MDAIRVVVTNFHPIQVTIDSRNELRAVMRALTEYVNSAARTPTFTQHCQDLLSKLEDLE